MDAVDIFHFFDDLNKNLLQINFGSIEVFFNEGTIENIDIWISVRKEESFKSPQITKDTIKLIEKITTKSLDMLCGSVTIKFSNARIVDCKMRFCISKRAK
ncbi:MAG: hypothetical protein D6734_09515 [Candidatus Schekmanbacteria bacterium]|nr:MAG: hypothetical protein D6734_09515 [Candidatus Schekmanbacteria bacterium]